MAKYKEKNPTVIEAVQWTGTNYKEIEEFVGDIPLGYGDLESCKNKILYLKGSNGIMTVEPKCYVIKGPFKNFYFLSADTFETLYELYEEDFCDLAERKTDEKTG